MAQIAAAELGVDPERVFVIAADTTLLPYGNGTGGSRVAANAGPVGGAHRARGGGQGARGGRGDARVRGGRRGAGRGPRPRGGAARARGGPGDLARAAVRSKTLLREARPGLQACGYFAPETVTFAFGAQACAVEVDVETGRVRILRYLAVHDCGRAINPMIVDGQLHGGLAGGIGTALMEDLLYDARRPAPDRQPDGLRDPAAADLPAFETRTLAFPSTRNDLGIKGVGESAIIAPPAAIANAVEDALHSRGADVLEVPVTPVAGVAGALQGEA